MEASEGAAPDAAPSKALLDLYRVIAQLGAGSTEEAPPQLTHAAADYSNAVVVDYH
jgi:hypothetical protein